MSSYTKHSPIPSCDRQPISQRGRLSGAHVGVGLLRLEDGVLAPHHGGQHPRHVPRRAFPGDPPLGGGSRFRSPKTLLTGISPSQSKLHEIREDSGDRWKGGGVWYEGLAATGPSPPPGVRCLRSHERPWSRASVIVVVWVPNRLRTPGLLIIHRQPPNLTYLLTLLKTLLPLGGCS